MTAKNTDSQIPKDLKRNLTIRFVMLGLCYLALSGGSYLVVSTALSENEYDGIIINIAGRQRVLTRKYSHEVTQVLVGIRASDQEQVEKAKKAVTKTVKQFERILTALNKGGEVDVIDIGQTWIPPAQGEEFSEHLAHVKTEWEKLKITSLKMLRSAKTIQSGNDHVSDFHFQTDRTIEEMDHVVTMLQKMYEAKLQRVASYVMYAFVLSVVLVLTTTWFLRARIIVPLHNSMASLKSEIAERLQIENDLRKLSVAVEQSPASVVITDINGTIEYVNPRFTEVTGYSKEEVIGQNPRILKSGKWPRKAYEGMWKMILAGKTWRGEFENKKKSGEIFWESASISPIWDSEHSVTHFLAVKEDITNRKHAEAELIKAKETAECANAAKSEFLANMSHEIRTPMTAILGFAENLLDNEQSESEKINAIHTIRRNGENLLGIINDILDLSKIETGKMIVECRECKPIQIIAEVASTARVRINAKLVALNFEYIGSIPETIVSDPTKVRQILINLVGNAIKFTETGTVRLVTRLVDGDNEPRLQFDVIDTGCGLTEEQAGMLFQPFMQADASASRKAGGTGLGLAISKRFAELLGGDINIVKTEIGVGTTFRATVSTGSLDGVKMLENPISETVVNDILVTISHPAQSDLQGYRILLAEDGLDNQRLISFMLEKAGAEVTVVENGKLAVDTALAAMNSGIEGDSELPFDMILMDMQMPVMDGYEATRQLRLMGYARPIIALTAHAMEGDRQRCIKAGCDDYATKPIDRKKLAAMILEQVEYVHR